MANSVIVLVLLQFGTSFAIHKEDMDLPAINIMHAGAPKIWYVVPEAYRSKMEELASEFFPSKCSMPLRHKNSMFTPETLRNYGIPAQRVVHIPNTIMIVAPGAYHQGFNSGLNFASAINYASPSWIPFGLKSRPCDCKKRISPVFSMKPFVREFMPEHYAEWLLTHPEKVCSCLSPADFNFLKSCHQIWLN